MQPSVSPASPVVSTQTAPAAFSVLPSSFPPLPPLPAPIVASLRIPGVASSSRNRSLYRKQCPSVHEPSSSVSKKAKFSDEDRINVYGSHLKGRAANSWSFFKKSYSSQSSCDETGSRWRALVTAFKKYFMPLHYEAKQTGKWHALSMNNGLLHYIQQFRMFMEKIPAATEREKWLELQYKIDQKARHFLSIKGITNFTDALDALYEYALGNAQDEKRMAAHQKIAVSTVRRTPTAKRAEKP